MTRATAKTLLCDCLSKVSQGIASNPDCRAEIEQIVDEICDGVRAELEPRLLKIERNLGVVANTAGCLANGVIPD